MKVVLKENFGELLYNEEFGYLTMVWAGNVDEENYKKYWNTLYDFILNNGIKKLIIDQRNIGNVAMQSRAWFLIKWVPRAKKAVNNFNCAVVASKHIFHSTGVHYLISGAKKITNYDIVLFQSMEEAESYMSK